MMPARSSYLNAQRIRERITSHPDLAGFAFVQPLAEVIAGPSNLSSTGFPFIVERSFHLFVERVPHLFRDGQRILDWMERLEKVLASFADLSEHEQTSLARTSKVIHNMVFTANVTAPPDLWLLRQVLGTWSELGLLKRLLDGEAINPCQPIEGLDSNQLGIDLDFMHARGLLLKEEGDFLVGGDASVHATLAAVKPLPETFRTRMIHHVCEWVMARGWGGHHDGLIESYFDLHVSLTHESGWEPDYDQIEMGYRLVPLVLGLRAAGLTEDLLPGEELREKLPFLLPQMRELLASAGLVHTGSITRLGARIFKRGPGPFGIIAAYDAYLNDLPSLLHGRRSGSWVSRGENVAASQDANSKTFDMANRALDSFCEKYGFNYDVFIEHAVGKGEATRQRYALSEDRVIRYFGADLEDAAIEEAQKEQRAGKLPPNMSFINGADIGNPGRITDFLRDHKVKSQGAVMIVGNGFHEIRGQTNEKMIEVFRGYQEAGILLIFTEETGLNNEDLLRTAWNTYHAGFRYVHEISGQGLRPARTDEAGGRWSWARCAGNAGYVVQEHYTRRTRTIYPFRKARRGNPSISITYFCVPRELALQLDLTEHAGEDRLTSF